MGLECKAGRCESYLTHFYTLFKTVIKGKGN